MSWHKGVRLGGDGHEDAFLMKSNTVCASTISGRIEPMTANLEMIVRILQTPIV